MPTYYQGNYKHPNHLSVGAVILNDEGKICCHHVIPENLKGYWADQGLGEMYILMRETPEPNDTIEQTLHRGMMEEFGIEAEMIDYVGSIVSHFKHKGVEVEKTTLYFLCKLKSQDLSKRSKEDVEGFTDVEWQTPDFLIPIMKEQTKKYGRTDLDESKVLEIVKNK